MSAQATASRHEAKRRLELQAGSVLAALTAEPDRRRIVRLETYVDDLDPLAWLRAQPAAKRVYWADREGAFAVAGVGAASEYRGEGPPDYARLFADLRADLSPAHPSLRYYGGMRFSANAPHDDRWRPFGAYYFSIPKYEAGRKGNRCYLACNTVVERGACPEDEVEETLEFFDGLVFPDGAGQPIFPTVQSRTDRPDANAWHAAVERLLDDFREGTLEKAVLARESLLECDAPVDPVDFLRRLSAAIPYSFQFCFQASPGPAFVGASPERLYKRVNTYLQGEAIAGTRKRGATPLEDAVLADELLHSDKERREHRFVADRINAIFSEYCRASRGGDRAELLALRPVQHLVTRMEGMLWEPDSDARLLPAFHPTPAVGGCPREAALDAIASLEPFDRGWFAGPVGWVGFDSTEFAVAIRSALVADHSISVYAGAGIVAGSKPADEWDELDNKLAGLLGLFDTDGLVDRNNER